WAMGVALAVYAVGRISGAHINPAVTVALASMGAFPWEQVPGYIGAQLLGAMAGAVLVWLSYLAHWGETDDQEGKLACYCTGPAVRNPLANCLTEFIGTVMLVFGVLAIGKLSTGLTGDLPAAMNTFAGPMLVGLLVFSIGLSLGGPTGYAINPARDLGPRIAHSLLPIAGKGGSDWMYAWIPVVIPLVGGVAGAQLFVFLGL
ncbi:MAG: MIP/aquaporin family protein, partial [Verrucomicrobiales bacterium]